MATPLKTLADVRDAFANAGLPVSDWAAINGFRRENVYAVLAGRTRGRRGEAHRIAQALGLKAKVSPLENEILAVGHEASPADEPTADGRTKPGSENAPMR
jgi:gp16 family phage-associated protein